MEERNYENEYWEAQSHINMLEGERRELREGAGMAKLQIEYLHGKFKETGTGNAVLVRLNAILERTHDNP